MPSDQQQERIAAECVEFIQRAGGNQYYTANRDFLLVHIGLLSDATDAFLAANSVDPHASPLAYAFARMRILFARCRETGVDNAFQEEEIKELSRALLGDGLFGNKEEFVRTHPILLTPTALQVIGDSAARQKSDGARHIFESLRDLLARCGVVGIEQAFSEYRERLPAHTQEKLDLVKVVGRLMNAATADERRDLLQRHPELLSDQAVQELQRCGDSRVAKKAAPLISLIAKCKAIGVKRAFALPREEQLKRNADAAAVVEAVGDFLFRTNTSAKRALLQRAPELLGPAAEEVLLQFAADLDDSAKPWVHKHRRLLVACRRVGIDAAFARYASSLGGEVHELTDRASKAAREIPDLLDLASRAERCRDLIPSLLTECEARLERISRDNDACTFTAIKMIIAQANSALPANAPGQPWMRAAATFREALDACNPNEQPVVCAILHARLAALLAKTPHGDRYANQQLAMRHSEQALAIWKSEEATGQIIETMLNISYLYRSFVAGDDPVYSDAAVAYCREALSMAGPESQHAAAILDSLGCALLNQDQGRETGALKEAGDCFRTAIALHEPGSAPAAIYLHLATSLLAQTATVGSAEDAIAQLLMAESQVDRLADPVEFAAIQREFARAYGRLSVVTHADAIVEYYRRAAQALTMESDPRGLMAAVIGIADTHAATQQWQVAFEAYTRALEVGQRIYAQGSSLTSKQVATDALADLYYRASYAAIKSGSPATEAIELLERGKGRILSENLRLHAGRPANVPEDVWFEYLAASYMMKQPAYNESHGLVNYERLEEGARLLESRLERAVAAVASHAPDFLTQSVWEVVGRYLSGSATAVVTFCCTEWGSLAFIVTAGQPVQVACVDVPGFTNGDLRSLVVRTPDSRGFARGGWLGLRSQYLKDGQPSSLATWRGQMQSTLEELGARLLQPVLKSIPSGTDKLVFVPSHELYVFPLQAIPIGQGGGQLVIDEYDVSVVPTFALLAHCHLHSRERRGREVLIIENPEADPQLRFAAVESIGIENCFEVVSVLRGQDATREASVKGLAKADIAHFCCHGSFDWRHPRESGVALSDGMLTVDEMIMGDITQVVERNQDGIRHLCLPVDLSRLKLVTLSACDSGMANVSRGNTAETLAVSSGFLVGGVPSVVCTLWPVPDVSTALLMERMYLLLRTGEATASALRGAVAWLRGVTSAELEERCLPSREQTRLPGEIRSSMWRHFAAMDPAVRPYEHPYFWAGFVAAGV